MKLWDTANVRAMHDRDFAISLPMIKTFIDVIDRGSITASARALHLSQSAASTHVATLARIAGGPLLTRREGRLEATPLGRVMYDSGADVLVSLSDLRTRLRHEVLAGESALALVCSDVACEATLARTLAGVAKAAPTLKVSVEIASDSETKRRLEDGSAEVVLVEGTQPVVGACFVPYDKTRVRIAMNGTHPLANTSGPITLDDLSEHRVLLLKRSAATRCFVERALGARFERLQIGLELESTEALVACLEAGIGVGFVSEAVLTRPLALGTLVGRDLADLPLVRTLSVGFRHDRALAPAAQWFVDWLIAAAAGETTSAARYD